MILATLCAGELHAASANPTAEKTRSTAKSYSTGSRTTAKTMDAKRVGGAPENKARKSVAEGPRGENREKTI